VFRQLLSAKDFQAQFLVDFIRESKRAVVDLAFESLPKASKELGDCRALVNGTLSGWKKAHARHWKFDADVFMLHQVGHQQKFVAFYI
jgi:hypothetical protein